jgi:hypothetical protein
MGENGIPLGLTRARAPGARGWHTWKAACAGPSSSDCEKSYHRTGIPSANMLRKAGMASGGPVIQIQPIYGLRTSLPAKFLQWAFSPRWDYFSDPPTADLCLSIV